MQRKGGFTLIELLLVMSIIMLVIGSIIPNLRIMQNQARTVAVQMNMREVSQAISSYLAENGHYADDFYEDGYGYIFDGGVKDQELGALPINPYTGKRMDPDEFNVDEYDTEQDVSNTSRGGPNDEWGYSPGEMRYAAYYPLGQYYPTMWGLIGFEGHGLSIRSLNEDNEPVIFVLHQ